MAVTKHPEISQLTPVESNEAGNVKKVDEYSAEATELENLEIRLLLEALYHHYGYDFREYAYASLRRRVALALKSECLSTISGLQERLLHDTACMRRFLFALSVNVTSLFRDPAYFLTFRTRVASLLRTYPFVRIWHAGCSTGEEVYSMAILLQEEGLYDRCRLYATDMDETVLKHAREGIYAQDTTEKQSVNYLQAGGTGKLSDYYTAGYGNAMFRASLRDNIVFSRHNLATDHSFNEFNVILCRNVMIYFTKPLQQRVHALLYSSLAMFGVLGIGSKESLQFMPHESDFEQIETGCKLYRRVR